MKTAFFQFLLIVVLGTGFAALAGRSLAGTPQEPPPPAEALAGGPAPADLPNLVRRAETLPVRRA
jgi:hypothetical protein